MKLNSFNKKPMHRVNELNRYLKENFGITVKGFHAKAKLEKVREQAQNKIVSIKNTNKKFQLDPEYAKFLGVRDIIDVMLEEGVYAESPAYESMCNEVREAVKSLMDSGYTDEEACAEAMNKYRKDARFAYDDNVVLPIALKAAKDYVEECGMGTMEDLAIEEEFAAPETDLNEYLLSELAKECGVELNSLESFDAIEEKLNAFSQVTGKSRDAVVGFLNGLDEESLVAGIQMFGKKIANENAYNQAAAAAAKANKKEFEFPEGSGKMHPVKMDKGTAHKVSGAKNESMFDDIIGDMISEEVEVEQAEVVMALRALADDIQDHIERIGRMINEDLPAIADQMSSEFGAEQAASMKATIEQSLQSVLDANKAGKEGVDATVGSLTGTGTMADMGMDAETGLGGEEIPAEEPVDNVPAAAGPEDEPMGRAPVDADSLEEI